MPTEMKFETMNDAAEHANFVGHAIQCTVGTELCTVQPSDTSPAVKAPLDEAGEASRALATFVDAATTIVHNFQGTKLKIWQMEQICSGKKCGSAEDILGQTIDIRHVMFHPVQVIDAEDGEIATMIRTVIMTPGLDAFGFVSQGVATSMMQLYKLFDGKPFNPPVSLQISQKTTRHGRRVYVVDPIMDEE